MVGHLPLLASIHQATGIVGPVTDFEVLHWCVPSSLPGVGHPTSRLLNLMGCQWIDSDIALWPSSGRFAVAPGVEREIDAPLRVEQQAEPLSSRP